MEVAIGGLHRRDVAQAVGILSRAFWDDPIMSYYLRSPRRRKLAYRVLFNSWLSSSLASGHVYGATNRDRLVGVALWEPPNPPPSRFPEQARSWLAAMAVRVLFPRTAGALFQGIEDIKPLHPKEPHWYLDFLCVDTDVQGRGIGSRLLAPVLNMADDTGTICYLETPFPRTHPFYRRHGFEIASESNPFGGAPTLWTMVRKPQRPSG